MNARRSSGSWWKTARTPGRRASISILNAAAPSIRIRDNGCGIGKDDLALALARQPVKSARSTTHGGDRQPRFSRRSAGQYQLGFPFDPDVAHRRPERGVAKPMPKGASEVVTVKPAAHRSAARWKCWICFYNTRRAASSCAPRKPNSAISTKWYGASRWRVSMCDQPQPQRQTDPPIPGGEESQHERRWAASAVRRFCSMR